jgi:hypothetical protein
VAIAAVAATALLLAAPALSNESGGRFGPGRDFPDFDAFDGRTFDRNPFQFAEMGDTEYSDEGIAHFANMTDDINA